jgi:hypothetical protein
MIALVVTFLIGLFSVFPLGSTASEAANFSSDTEGTQTIDVDSVEEVAELFLLSYQDLIEDIVSFQDDPSLDRAESRKRTFIAFAQDVMARYQDFTRELREKLDELTLESGEESSE